MLNAVSEASGPATAPSSTTTFEMSLLAGPSSAASVFHRVRCMGRLRAGPLPPPLPIAIFPAGAVWSEILDVVAFACGGST